MLIRPDGQPCPDIDWEAYDSYATWSTDRGGIPDDVYEQRLREVQAQGLDFVDAPHLCHIDGDSYVWAIALT